MKRHHVVFITTRGYHRLASYETQAEALRHVAKATNRTGSHVYRNGITGARYSMKECEALAAQEAPCATS